jgi:hypothetical protein
MGIGIGHASPQCDLAEPQFVDPIFAETAGQVVEKLLAVLPRREPEAEDVDANIMALPMTPSWPDSIALSGSFDVSPGDDAIAIQP